jgi:predicted nucleotidyltransferase
LNPVFTDVERSCLARFVALLQERRAEDLRAIWLFGSFARGDMWSRRMPMNSDIDLLIVTEVGVDEVEREAILNETDALYLECGRQISPQFWTVAKFDDPPTDAAKAFQTARSEGGSPHLPARRAREPEDDR